MIGSDFSDATPIDATKVKFAKFEVKLKSPVQVVPAPVTVAEATRAPDACLKYTYGFGSPPAEGVYVPDAEK